ncbi:MAG: extracellular solute-binding protein [Anaerolineae bacterium]|nr:extracellular solute-binding protein [Anaerolineae bacterium]
MAIIDRNSAIPLYYQLKLHFKEQIETGELRVGDQLPTEAELCERLGISRAPVRQAMADLAREGLIYRRAGAGSFVAPQASAALIRRTELRVLAHYDVRWLASLEQAVMTWNEAHPEHEVDVDIRMCARNEFHQVLQRSTVRGEAPDLAAMDFVWLNYYANEGYITPLNDLDARWVGNTAQDLEPPVLKNNIVDGQLYGIPVQADMSGLWYRKDWFEAEGLKAPQTWESWLAVMDHFALPDTMARYGHRYSVVLPVTATTGEATVNLLFPFMWMAGADIVDSEGHLVLVEHLDQACEALRFLQTITLDRRAYLPKDVYRSRWWHLVRYFAQGDVPMTLGGSYEWPRIQEESVWHSEADAAENLGFVTLPRPSLDVKPVASLGGTSWVIFEQSEEQALALELLKLMATSNASATFCEENLQVSPYVSVNQRFASEAHPWLSALVPLLTYVRNRPLIPNYNRVSGFLQDMFEHVLWEGADPEDAIRKTAQALSVVMTAV